MTTDVRPLDPGHRDQAAGLLAEAFRDDPSLDYFFGSRNPHAPGERDRQAVAFFRLVLGAAQAGGGGVWGLFRGPTLAAVAVTEDQRTNWVGRVRRSTAELVYLLGVLGTISGSALGRIEAYRQRVRRAHRSDLDHYLVVVGVSPGLQGRGLGRTLVGTLTSRRPGVWGLDTENPANVGVYQRWGWGLTGTVGLDNLEVFLLSWEGYKEVL